MSRYTVESAVPGFKAILGWDDTQQTYFAMLVESTPTVVHEADIYFIVGVEPGTQCVDFHTFMLRVKDYMHVNGEVCESLQADRPQLAQA